MRCDERLSPFGHFSFELKRKVADSRRVLRRRLPGLEQLDHFLFAVAHQGISMARAEIHEIQIPPFGWPPRIMPSGSHLAVLPRQSPAKMVPPLVSEYRTTYGPDQTTKLLEMMDGGIQP